tara:strand:+ start:432717 stop:433508 length:792 start_codon:yes stop_codon:yes gene_type:complete
MFEIFKNLFAKEKDLKQTKPSSNYEYIVLVDYDNVKLLFRNRGVEHVVNRIITNISPRLNSKYNRIRLRLYGGWYQNQTLSKNAQKLSSDITTKFPTVESINFNNEIYKCIINVELAYTLEFDHKHKLFNTYRKRTIPSGIKANRAPYHNCKNNKNCELSNIYRFIKDKSCPNSICDVPLNDVLEKNEQKLVDTMITSDIIYLSFNDNTELCVVTSDDDILPGINTALYNNTKLIHLHTHSNRKTPTYYIPTSNNSYVQLNMS